MEFQIINKPSFQIIGYPLRTIVKNGQNLRDIPAFWDQYFAKKLGQQLYAQAAVEAEYGICDEFDPATGEFTYIIGVEPKEDAVLPEGAIHRTYPAQQYAVFTTPKVTREHFSDTIQQTWAYVSQEWLPNSEYVHAYAPEFEYYDYRCYPDLEQVEMDIYIPITSK